MPDIPVPVRGKALVFGAERWLDGLPDLISDLEREWSLRTGRSYPASTEAVVLDAIQAGGTPAVLKLCVPNRGDAARNEITALRLIGGDGAPRLLRYDESRGALLMERLGRPMNELGLPVAERHEHLCAAALKIWRPAAGCGLPTGGWKGRWLADSILRMWEELGRPCTEAAVSHALDCGARRTAAHDEERAVLVHGDVHEWNALRSGDGFKLADPDGLLAEPEYDLGVMMREDPVDLMRGDPRDLAWSLARRCGGLDPVAGWEGGGVERGAAGPVCAETHL